MYLDEKDIPEINKLKHRHDDDKNFFYYEDKILKNNLSPHIFGNEIMSEFLTRCQRLVAILFDNVNIIKNFKNFNVDKYYYKQKN